MSNEEFIESVRLENEEWKPVKGSDNGYYVSTLGRVLSMKQKTPRFLKLDYRCYYKSTLYTEINLRINKKHKRIRIGHLVAMTFLDNPRRFRDVEHINCDGTDNRLENLRWCSHTQNMNNPMTKAKMRESRLRFNKAKKESLPE